MPPWAAVFSSDDTATTVTVTGGKGGTLSEWRTAAWPN